MSEHYLAEYNIARLLRPLDAQDNAEFVAALEGTNRIAETSQGFVWRLTDDDGRSSSYVHAYDDPLLIVNYSIWADVESLKHFTYRSGHVAYFRRRREWFEEGSSRMVCWWTPVGAIPPLAEAVRRLELLAANGPSPEAFTMAQAFPAPASTVGGASMAR